jgi:hypothetical protein
MRAFISYAHSDGAMLDRLHAHLAMLRRDGTLSQWYDRDIMAGGDINKEVAKELSRCQLFLALASPDFLNSQYCYETEMTNAIRRHDAGEIIIVPVILEPCDWLSSPLARFKALPRDGKAISAWTNQNTAFLDVVNELRRLASSAGLTEPGVPTSAPSKGVAGTPKYRVKHSFDQIDRDNFRVDAYEVIRDYFDKSTRELDGVEGLRGRYQSMGPVSFTCAVVNQMMRNSQSGTASITVHAGGRLGLGDIYYSHEANSSDNRSNGSFRIDADDYHLYLRADFFDMSESRRTWSPQEAANRLWEELLGRAGITYG